MLIGELVMTPSEKSLSQILQIEGNQEHYFIPKYQRPYKWGRDNWDDLIRDIGEDADHFMGSIICVPRTNDTAAPGEEKYFELIDGQQRLTTISLLLCAIYQKLEDSRPTDEDSETVHSDFLLLRNGIAKKLVKEKPIKQLSPNDEPAEKSTKAAFFPRLSPSTQSQNLADYLYVLVQCGLLKSSPYPNNWGNRRVAKCFSHFRDHLPSDMDELRSLVEQVNNLRFIHISVPTQSDAYRLFEALNNRGQPLSALDIIKNGLLARIEKQTHGAIDDAFEQWKEMTDLLTDDEAVQERYLRHFYHAFRHKPEINVKGIPRATRSTIIRIYESLAKSDPVKLLTALVDGAKLYQMLVNPEEAKLSAKRRKILIDLDRIGAAPAYQGLLYFLSAEKDRQVENEVTVDEIAGYLARYFVRRNVTDQPGTNRLDAIFSGLIEACQNVISKGKKITASFVIAHLTNNKTDKPSDDEAFREYLEDNLWRYNDGMARYVLCKLDESYSSREYAPNLWKRDERGRFVWTVEHVLPQTGNLRKEWVDMLTGGDLIKANEIQESWGDCLGNLTLSGYNSKLSDKPFTTKQTSHEMTIAGDTINIGYKNGLALNTLSFRVPGMRGKGKEVALSSSKTWTATEIEARNVAITEKLLKIFKL